ncbi:hypothetical protein Daesc_001143 [Daldinia eschscholtzii]|uniref:Uncharacterized protein n=1 Tax=Daldinia eschscholtzii TaxID=292717 RepID=A0AAX6N0S1_9PEZI
MTRLILTHTDDETEEQTEQELLRKLSQGKLRWGVTEMPSSLSTVLDPEINVTHLSLTGEDEYLSEPVENSSYV